MACNLLIRRLEWFMETEEEGFEPPSPCGESVFETDAISHSATLPKLFFLRREFFVKRTFEVVFVHFVVLVMSEVADL